MWRLIKSEIDYFSHILMIIVSLLIAFTIFSNLNIQLFKESRFWNRYFWAALIGTGTYFLIYIIWNQRLRERRDRFHALLPIKTKSIASARILFGLFPVFFVALFLLLIGFLSSNNMKNDFYGSFAQLGLSFIFLVIILILFDARFLFKTNDKDSAPLQLFIIGILLVVISFAAVFLIAIPLYNLFFNNGEEIIFYIWGLVLSIFSKIIYEKRKSFIY